MIPFKKQLNTQIEEFRPCSYFFLPCIESYRSAVYSEVSCVIILSTSNRIPTIVAMVLLLWRQNILLWHQITMVASEQHLYQTIVLPRKLAIGSIHDYLFCYCPVVGILFEVRRIYNFLGFSPSGIPHLLCVIWPISEWIITCHLT